MSTFSASSRRILCLQLPRLPTDRYRRQQRREDLRAGTADRKADERPPLVIAAKIDNALQVSAVDDVAASQGLIEGMPLATARAMVPALTIIDADPVADHKTLCDIADWCDRFTPLVALDGTSGLFLDISGCAHLFGGEAALMTSACAALSRQGFIVHGAIAGTAVAARALARGARGQIVACGKEAAAVAPLPLESLGEDASIIRGLQRAGLKTIGDVTRRPAAEIAARFGAEFVSVLRQALGREDAPISPRKPAPDFVVEKRFAEPIATEDVIVSTLDALGDVLIKAMDRHGKGARRLEASFFRTDGAVRSIAVEAGQAVTQVRVIRRLFAEKLGALADPLDPGFGFDLMRLSASHTVIVTAIQQGFDTGANAIGDVEQLVDRLTARIGRHRVIVQLPQATHIPERTMMVLPAQHNLKAALQAQWRAGVEGEPPLRPLRMFAQPEPIEVIAQVPDGPPAQFSWRGLAHAVVRAEGPERIAMEWWRAIHREIDEIEDDAFAQRHPPQIDTSEKPIINQAVLTRDYFRVEDDAGFRFWLYRNGLYGRELIASNGAFQYPCWFMHGLFA